jgi:hypothetical protein
MMSAPWPPIRSRRSRGRSFRRRLGRIKNERCLLDLLADEGVAEVFRPVLAEGLRFRVFGQHEEGHVSPAAGLVEDLAVGRLDVAPDRFDRREFVSDRAADEAGRTRFENQPSQKYFDRMWSPPQTCAALISYIKPLEIPYMAASTLAV